MENYTAIFEVNGQVYEAEAKQRSNETATHTIHFSGLPAPEMEQPGLSQQCRFKDDARHEGYECLNCKADAEWRKFNREEVKIMKAFAAAIFPGSTAKIGFSRYAGCSCPCSPGLVVRDSFGDQRFPRYVVTYVTVSRVTE